MELIAAPRESLADVAPLIELVGADETEPARLTLETEDAAGNLWRSVTRQAGGDPARPWWDMDFAAHRVAPVAFSTPPDHFAVSARVEAGTRTMQAKLVRILRAGPAPETLLGDGFRLTVFPPAGAAPGKAVLFVPPASSSVSFHGQAALLASHGHTVGLVSYVAEFGLPIALDGIPLERIADAYRALRAHPAALGRQMAVMAVAAGTGGALAALSSFEDLEPTGVIAVSPTNVIWQASNDYARAPRRSSWTLADRPLPWLPVADQRLMPLARRRAIAERFPRHPAVRALLLRPAYETALKEAGPGSAAEIAVENVDCPLLSIAGEDDEVWPGAEMARRIALRRSNPEDRLLIFPHAGHRFGVPYTPTTVPWSDSVFLGGTAAGTALAQAESWAEVLAFLATPSVDRGRPPSVLAGSSMARDVTEPGRADERPPAWQG